MSRRIIAALSAMAMVSVLLFSAGASAQDADTYRITFTNVTTGQPMTPPVVAIHDASAVQIFQSGQAAIPELQAIAENGDNGPLVALAGTLPTSVLSAGGVAAPDPAGPILPGASVSIDLTSGAAGHSLSTVAMIVCTNDGFTGLDSVALPAPGASSSFDLKAYDAGTETNVIDPDYWVPPCGGDGSNMHTDENGVVTPHPGQTVAVSDSVSLSFNGLEPLGASAVYEGWLIINGAPVSTGTFNIDAAGAVQPIAPATVANASAATTFVLTIEPAVDPDPAPAATHVLAGDFNGGTAPLTISHPAALGTDLSAAGSTFIVATPTTATDADNLSGVWFLDPTSGTPMPSLNLPTLPAGWHYEGWVVIDGTPVSTGRFTSVSGPDDFGGFSGPQPAPPFPGEDFVLNAPAGLTFPTDLTGRTVVISVEPDPDDSPAPFALKPLVGDVPAGVQVGSPNPLGAGPIAITGTATIEAAAASPFDLAAGETVARLTIENLSAAAAPAPAQPAPAPAPSVSVPSGTSTDAATGCPDGETCGLGFNNPATTTITPTTPADKPLELALTGAETSTIAMVGFLLVAMGAAAIATTKRRTQ